VATVAIGKAGAKNAGVLAARILALQDEQLSKRLLEYRTKMAKDVEKKGKELSSRSASA
jgi:5-(carboxyamino)imidazole ribonucleotide mutase